MISASPVPESIVIVAVSWVAASFRQTGSTVAVLIEMPLTQLAATTGKSLFLADLKLEKSKSFVPLPNVYL